MPYTIVKMFMWDFQCEILNAKNVTFTDFEFPGFSSVMELSILPENTSCRTSIQNQLMVKISR